MALTLAGKNTVCWVIVSVMSTVGQTVGRLGRDDATRSGKRGEYSDWNFQLGITGA